MDALIGNLSASSIVDCFRLFTTFSDEFVDAKSQTFVLIASWSTNALQRNATDTDDNNTFFQHHHLGVLAQVVPSFTEASSADGARRFGEESLRSLREQDAEMGMPPASFINNFRFGQDVNEVYSNEIARKSKGAKVLWHPEDVFYSPVCS